MRPRPAVNRKPAQQGAGLIEVLVAVLVLAVGILGIALAQTRALVTTGGAGHRVLAVMDANSLFEIMRLNPAAVRAGTYNARFTAQDCPGGMVLAHWCQSLGTTLGGGANTQANIACTDAGACTLTLQWVPRHQQGQAQGEPESIEINAQIPEQG